MTPRPQLAHLFAVHYDDPRPLERIAEALEEGGEFLEVWRPLPGWVAASAPLPGSEPEPQAVHENGLAFAEGRDGLEEAAGREAATFFRAVADTADHFPDQLAALSGDFGFIRFRPRGAATIARSCGGLVPFYIWRGDRHVAISTSLGYLVRYLPEGTRLDPLVNAVWTTGHTFFPDGRTFLADVRLLDAGCAALIEAGRPVRCRRYWHPRPVRIEAPTEPRRVEHAERLRALLIKKLARDLDPLGGNLLTLSGGVDSSSLAALAVGVLGRSVWTWSLVPESGELFEREMSYIRPLAKQFGFERTWMVPLREMTVIDLLHQAPRITFPVIHPALAALPAVVREAAVRVLFGGEFADEVCGSGGTLPDWAASTSFSRLAAGLDRLPFGYLDVLRWVKHRSRATIGRPVLPFPIDLPEFIRPEIREEYRTWRARRQREAARDDRARGYLALLIEAAGWVPMNWEATSALGVRRSFPFFNREVLELAFECHPAELVGAGTKKLLRTALRRDVPARNLFRPDKGYCGPRPRDVQIPWRTTFPDLLRPILREEWIDTPPQFIRRWHARGVWQLVLFAEAVASQVAARRFSVAEVGHACS